MQRKLTILSLARRRGFGLKLITFPSLHPLFSLSLSQASDRGRHLDPSRLFPKWIPEQFLSPAILSESHQYYNPIIVLRLSRAHKSLKHSTALHGRRCIRQTRARLFLAWFEDWTEESDNLSCNFSSSSSSLLTSKHREIKSFSSLSLFRFFGWWWGRRDAEKQAIREFDIICHFLPFQA